MKTMKEKCTKTLGMSLLLVLVIALVIVLQPAASMFRVEAAIGGGGGGGGQPWITIKQMYIDFNQQPNEDSIAITEATFSLPEGATHDLNTDDVTVTVDSVTIMIPAGSFIKRGNNEKYIFQSTKGARPKVNMKLDFDKGEWNLKVSKIDASAIDSRYGVPVTFSIGTSSTTERIDMWAERLSYKAEP